jgi:murein DD-endopeptidase MepM/ murein hydrolase activator NlpD
VTTRPHSPSAPLTRREARELESARVAALAPSKPAAKSVRVKFVKPPRRRKRIGSQLLSLGAMMFAGALVVALSVPANAFMTEAAPTYLVTTSDEPVQSIAVSEEVAAPAPVRDEFGVTSYAELLRIKYANTHSYTATTGAIRWPFPYPVPITDGFGDRPPGSAGTAHHNGVDFVPGAGTPIYAIADGVVSLHQEDQYGFGNHVFLSHSVNGENFDSVYAHMQYGSSPLAVGDTIKVGDFIGLVGNTGASYGAHLHFEIRIGGVPVDPFAWLQAHATN